LVGAVERIINTNWDAIQPPPQGTGRASYLTAVTEVENELIEILDVEKILNEISPLGTDVSDDVAANLSTEGHEDKIIFIADDSAVARNQVKKALTALGLEIEMAKNGQEALDRLKEIAEETGDITNRVGVLVSDIEMPEMDGYTLTAEIKNTPELQNLHVVLHTSLSGVFNQAMVQKVGADDFIAKFHPDELATAVEKWLKV
jgi:two-component system chemotaxis response regulator CheV